MQRRSATNRKRIGATSKMGSPTMWTQCSRSDAHKCKPGAQAGASASAAPSHAALLRRTCLGGHHAGASLFGDAAGTQARPSPRELRPRFTPSSAMLSIMRVSNARTRRTRGIPKYSKLVSTRGDGRKIGRQKIYTCREVFGYLMAQRKNAFVLDSHSLMIAFDKRSLSDQ